MNSTVNIYHEDTANAVAAHLLKINAIKLQPSDPFTWASGWKSPIYCDNRMALSYPKTRDFLKLKMAHAAKQLYPNAEVVAGVATGAIALGVLVADVLQLPFVYVRPEPKSHGRKNQVEGHLPQGKKVLVIEDLISTGKSSLLAVDALRKEGAEVLGMLAIFTYEFEASEENMRKAQCPLHTLSSYSYLINEAKRLSYIKENDIETLTLWRQSPSTWLSE
ncbi:MAG: orotate phosphoribosyltransferase [Cryomorphaceae bacterium]|nr:orotate phosphoribosyltransferase [Cryomorphaceae bacterium]